MTELGVKPPTYCRVKYGILDARHAGGAGRSTRRQESDEEHSSAALAPFEISLSSEQACCVQTRQQYLPKGSAYSHYYLLLLALARFALYS